MSDNWRIVALVVWKRPYPAIAYPHIASIRLSKRMRIILEVSEWIQQCGGWAFLFVGDILHKVKALTAKRYAKSHAWRIALSDVLGRIFREVRKRELYPLETIYADSEFQHYSSIVMDIFQAKVYIGKYSEILPADVLAYAMHAGKLSKHNKIIIISEKQQSSCLLYTSPSPRDRG